MMERDQGLGVPEHRLHPVALRRSGEQIHLTKDTGLGRNPALEPGGLEEAVAVFCFAPLTPAAEFGEAQGERHQLSPWFDPHD